MTTSVTHRGSDNILIIRNSFDPFIQLVLFACLVDGKEVRLSSDAGTRTTITQTPNLQWITKRTLEYTRNSRLYHHQYFIIIIEGEVKAIVRLAGAQLGLSGCRLQGPESVHSGNGLLLLALRQLVSCLLYTSPSPRD